MAFVFEFFILICQTSSLSPSNPRSQPPMQMHQNWRDQCSTLSATWPMWSTFGWPVSGFVVCDWHCTDDYLFIGLLESWPLPSGVEQFQMWELMDRLALENQVIEGMMGQLRMVCNFNNMLIKQWDPGHVDAGNGWAAAAAWEQE